MRLTKPLRRGVPVILGLLVVMAGWLFLQSSRPPAAHLSKPPVAPHIAEKLAPGDLIFRSGTAYESYLIKQLSGSAFSHIGVVVQGAPAVAIIHATTDDDPARMNQVIRSSLAEFVSPELAAHWAVYRLPGLDSHSRAHLLQVLESNLGLPFRLRASETDSERYCTTIIRDGLPPALQQQLQARPTSYPGFKGELLFPEAFLALQPLELIYTSD
ncbi:hypothetical protein AAEX37_02205 [Oligella sp. MSHR50489EDL]|uniref:hypothetical protein n=1 Tax=Oligella sp. MSHR50489EDL TaxID=3139409 RepID=UPI003D81904A